MLDRLRAETDTLGKPEWRPMLRYVAELHERSTHPAAPPFSRPWEEIGPGYCYQPAFGHWDIVHQVLDVLPAEPEHARDQLLNNLENQQADGLVPGSIWMRVPGGEWNTTAGHPPVWPVAVQDYCDRVGGTDLLADCYPALVKQIGWFEEARRAEGEGYYYTDILDHTWESGVDEGIRFDEIATGPFACIDATSHVYLLYEYAARWAPARGVDSQPFAARAAALRAFLGTRLFSQETGFFHDVWAEGRPEARRLAFEGMWPVVVGAATPEQAARVIDENLLNPARFFTPHPIASVGREDPRFELRMWRGPAWNSMTYWAARGCMRYGRREAAQALLAAALDQSAAQFTRTGTIWEFYHPLGGAPEEVRRKPHTPYNAPCPDYLGHNPLLAMARLWETVAET
jgi:putative isomerase